VHLAGSPKVVLGGRLKRDEMVAAESGVSLSGATWIYPFAEPGLLAREAQALVGELQHSLQMDGHHDRDPAHVRRMFHFLTLQLVSISQVLQNITTNN
jgi:hypothetical protein